MSFPGGRQGRYFSGIVSRFSSGDRNGNKSTYRAELVPAFWLLTKTTDRRIFQQQSVPDILRQVLGGLDVSYRLQGDYQPRNYCVQYRETDYDFACRLMEEEGIYYYFTHSATGHQLVLGDSPVGHLDVPGPGTLTYDPRANPPAGSPTVDSWTKSQLLRSAKVTLGDHEFELPEDRIEATALMQESATAGQVAHQLQVPATASLELYDYPGGYAERFDGEPEQVQPDAQRTAAIRIQQEAAGALEIKGSSFAGNLTGGHRFALSGHFDGDGQYVLTEVEHSASLPDANSGHLSYTNSFRCIPVVAAVPAAPRDAGPDRGRHGDGRGRRAARRGDPHRRARADQGAVPLGPRGPARREQLVLDQGRAAGSAGPARGAADRRRGRDLVRGWRSRPPDRGWPALALSVVARLSPMAEKVRLGGMALVNGVLVHGPHAWACAVRTDDGELKVAASTSVCAQPRSRTRSCAARRGSPRSSRSCRRSTGDCPRPSCRSSVRRCSRRCSGPRSQSRRSRARRA